MEKEFNIKKLNTLSGRAIAAISLLLITISIILSLFFTNTQKNYMENDLKIRTIALTNNLAYNSQYSVLTGYRQELQKLINGIMNEEDIVYAYIVDAVNYTIIGHSDTTLIGTIIDSNKLESLDVDNTNYREIDLPRYDNRIIEISSPIIIIPSSNDINEETFFDQNESSDNISIADTTAMEIESRLIGIAWVGVSTKNLNAAIDRITRTGIIITAAIILPGIFFTIILMTRFITKPLHSLMHATEFVASGDLDYQVKVDRKDEIGILAKSFNQMTEELKKSRKKIEGWNKVLEFRVMKRTEELSRKNLELKKYSNELQNAVEELTTLDKSKDVFLALVSHELRTPLSSIVAYTEVLLDDMADTKEEEKEYLNIIKNESDRLTRLINDVLDISKMEAGRMPFDFRTHELNGMINSSVTGLTSLANKKDIVIFNNLENSDILVNVDADKIIQVISNLISNAIKFSPDNASIIISGKENKNMVEIAVADKGIGIRKKDFEKVFDKFRQIEDVKHHSEGTGLGMPISKLIIENHNGKIWFDSKINKGTTFYFTLPLYQG
ncbi:ATP-binding protein [candidate division KSB1 bacterium]